MFRVEDVLHLKPGEHIRAFARRHWLTLMPPLFLALFLIVLPFFLLFPLFAWGAPGIFLFAACVVFGILTAVRSFWTWDADVLIVTECRVVVVRQRGVFHRAVGEMMLADVTDVQWMRRGVWETVIPMGTLTIAGSSSQGALTMHRVPRPDRLQALLNELREAKRAALSPAVSAAPPRPMMAERPYELRGVASGTLPAAGSSERSARLSRLGSLLSTFSDDELGRIEQILNARRAQADEEAMSAEEDPMATEDGLTPAVEDAA